MYRILILEDDDDLRPVLVELLEEEGFQVDSCGAGDEAINLARGREYDLMVADVRMEGLDGLSTLSQVQSYRPEVDALVISGYADAEQAERISRLGFAAALKKPFQLDTFLYKVNSLLKNRAQKLKAQRDFDHLLNISRWSLGQLARSQNHKADRRYEFSRLLEVCSLLGSGMDLFAGHLEQIKAAVLAVACGQSGRPESQELQMELPPHFDHWFEHIGEWWNGNGPKQIRAKDIPLESRIMVLSLACGRVGPEGELEERWPGRFDPNLLAILERGLGIEESGPETEPESGVESLLDVATTLARRGDFSHASEALQELVQQEAESREGVEALILLAKLKHKEGRAQEAKQMACRTPELAQSFGPGLAAYAFRESGRLLLELSEPDHAGHSFLKAQQLYEELGLVAHGAECSLLESLAKNELAQNPRSSEHLALLLTPQHRGHLLGCAESLLEALLKEQNLPMPLQKALARLMFSHSQAAKTVLMRAPCESQKQALELIHKVSPARYVGLLQTLSDSSYSEIRNAAKASMPTSTESRERLPLNISTLGGLVAEVGDQRVPDREWKTNKARYLLGRLVEAHPSPIIEDILVEEFWPKNLEKGKRSLYTACSSIRCALRKFGLESKDIVEKALNGIKLADDIEINYDIANLRETLKLAHQQDKAGDLNSALVRYREAVLDFSKPYLPNCYNDWALNLRREVESQLLDASVRIAEISYGRGLHQEVLEFARRALAFDSAHEVATGLLVSSLLQLGRPAEAEKRYRTFCQVLKQELDINDPGSLDELIARTVESLGNYDRLAL